MKGFISDPVKYLSIPYLDRGASFEGCDCWGLVCLYYKNELGIELPHFSNFAAQNTPLFNKAEQARIHDVMIISDSGQAGHCGVIISDREFLHTMESAGVHISRIDLWKDRIMSFHRHREQ